MNRRRGGFTLIELIVVILVITILLSLLLPAVQSAREAARRMQCVNNLVQVGISLASYEATYEVLPPGTVDTKGPIVELPNSYQFSWIAQILPHLDKKTIYRNLDFRSGVYSSANSTARGVSIATLNCPSDPSRSGSVYAACHNDVEAPIDVKNRGVFFLNSSVRLDDIEDGLAQTIFVGEKRGGSGDELGWASGTRATLRNTGTPINETTMMTTALSPLNAAMAEGTTVPNPLGGTPLRDDEIPPEARVTQVKPVPVGGFGSYHSGGSNFLFGDGSVHFVKVTIQQTIYHRLGSRNDGQPIGDDQF